MTRDFDFDRAVEEWLIEGPSQLPDRAIDGIVRQLDTTPQRKHWWLPGREQMNRTIFALAGAAAVVVVAVVALGLYYNQQPGVGDPAPSPSPTVAPTAAPTEAPPASPTSAGWGVPLLPCCGEQLDPGQYGVEDAGYMFMIDVPSAGWTSDSWLIGRGAEQNDPPDLAVLGLWGNPGHAYGDPCEWTGTEIPTGQTAQEMAAVLAELDSFSPSAPQDVTVGGHTGKRVVLTVPSDIEWSTGDNHFPQCEDGQYHSFEGRYYQGAGQVDEVWMLDVDGERRVVVLTYFPTTPDEAKADLARMMETMQITPIDE